MIDLNDIAVFLKVVEVGSFTAAAKALNLPKTSVSRKIAHLEDSLGTRLLQRTTRSLGLTDAGRRYYAQCGGALAAIDEANREVTGTQAIPSGTIRIGAPADPGSLFLSDSIADFLKEHERVNVELILTDERLNLVKERIDVSFRMGQLADSTLIARKLATGERVLCASPGYLEAAGRPKTPTDLKTHAAIVHGDAVDVANWTLRGPKSAVTVAVRARLAVNSMAFVLKAAVTGLGIAMLPLPMAARDLRAGRLVTVLPDYRPPGGAINIVYPSNRHLSAATKAFIDFVTKRTAGLRRHK